MAAVGGTSPPRTMASFKAQRTQARPKHSLFGTALEHMDSGDLQGIDPSDASQIGVRKQPDRYPIPEHLQQHISGRAMLEKAKGEVRCQSKLLTDVDRSLHNKELQALSFKAASAGAPHQDRSNRGWMTKKDLEHASEINVVGLNKAGSYNRDRYGSKPPTHNYALIGSVLTKGGDFGHPKTYNPDQTLVDLNQQDNNNTDRESVRLGFNPPVDPDVEFPPKPKSAVDLPPNIRHEFGSRVCDVLLSDKKAVEQTLRRHAEQSRKSKPPMTVDTKDYDVKAQSSYFDMGHKTRYNVFPGQSVPTMQSEVKSAHTEGVYLRRVPPPDEYRIVKDAYGTWAEQNLVREKMKKEWDAAAAPKAPV